MRALLISLGLAFVSHASGAESPVTPAERIRLPDAHKGDLTIDTRLMDSYGRLPGPRRQFYLDARQVLAAAPTASIADPNIIAAARKAGLPLISGPMLGDVSATGITIWFRSLAVDRVTAKVTNEASNEMKTFTVEAAKPGAPTRVRFTDLAADTDYAYQLTGSQGNPLGDGGFRTAPKAGENTKMRIAFGSCFHKIGVHNPNLMRLIKARGNRAMLLLGDLAVDDRDTRLNMHQADYLLRDVSMAWRQFAAHVPVYASWDDHDYLNNDKSGLNKGRISDTDRNNLRQVWKENWVNPDTTVKDRGIYFNTSIGDVDIVMLDTRSCRDNAQRGHRDSYLGLEQKKWLFDTLKKSKAAFIIITSGTMWSDYISNGKDSWGTWDTEVREEIFTFIENNRIGGVLLLSGDRHGARGFKIPRPSGSAFYEFEPATLGGVRGPGPYGADKSTQLFGYGKIRAFGEFTFDFTKPDPEVTFRLIGEDGDAMETVTLTRSQLTPGK